MGDGPSVLLVDDEPAVAEDARFLHAHGLPFLPKPLPRNGAELEEMVSEIVTRVGRAPAGTPPRRTSFAPKA